MNVLYPLESNPGTIYCDETPCFVTINCFGIVVQILSEGLRFPPVKRLITQIFYPEHAQTDALLSFY